MLTFESEQAAKNMSQIADMMSAINKKAPPQAFDALDRFKNVNGLAIISAMQAVVLSGYQPLQRQILELGAMHPNCTPPRF